MYRAISLGEITQKEWLMALSKEGLSGTLMGCLLGCGVFSFSFLYPGFEPKVALTVAVSLPVSEIANKENRLRGLSSRKTSNI